MIYVISDIHGCWTQFQTLLQKVHFGPQDTLYVLGDVIDRGPGSIQVLQEMAKHQNILPIIGDHEYMALQSLYHLCPWIKEKVHYPFWHEDIQSGIHCWLNLDGGRITYDAFKQLPIEQQISLLNYLWSFQLYHQIEVNGQAYLLTHGWLNHFEAEANQHPYYLFEQRFQSPDFETLAYPHHLVVMGHVPTRYLSGKDEVIFSKNYIAIDCGAYLGGHLALLCLNNQKVYYA